MKECEKIDKYLDLARELKKLWNTKVTVTQIAISVFEKAKKRDKGILRSVEESRPKLIFRRARKT